MAPIAQTRHRRQAAWLAPAKNARAASCTQPAASVTCSLVVYGALQEIHTWMAQQQSDTARSKHRVRLSEASRGRRRGGGTTRP